MALTDRAMNVLPTLVDEFKSYDEPIFFVTHSLGGLVVKATLRYAEQIANHDVPTADFLSRVQRVVFIGTPHFGSDIAKLANALSAVVWPGSALQGLSSNDANLRSLNSWYRSFSSIADIDGLVLTESKPLRILGLSWMIVEPNSGDPGLSPKVQVVPMDEDHISIRSPKNRNSDVYKRIRDFIDQPVRSITHPNKADDRDSLGARVEAALANTDVPAATRELSERLDILRKSRFLVGFDPMKDCKRLLTEIEGGDLTHASNDQKRSAYAWVARILAPVDVIVAKQYLANAESLGDNIENTVAKAFVEYFQDNDKPAALLQLSQFNIPITRTASFWIASHGVSKEEGLLWLQNAGLRASDLDADGKLLVLTQRTDMGDWDGAFEDVKNLNEEDFIATPVLLHSAAMTYLAQAIHNDLRSSAVVYLPQGLEDFPLAVDADSMAQRKMARDLYSRAATEFSRLQAKHAAAIAGDFALWLSLRDPEISKEARRTLDSSMGEPEHRLRRLPMALDFGLNLDLNAVEQEIDRETALSGGKSPEAAVARFSLAMTKRQPKDVALYIESHRSQLSIYYTSEYLTAFEIEALTKSGDISEATAKLDEFEQTDVGNDVIARLRNIIEEAAGTDPITLRKKQYNETKKLSDLINFVQILNSQNSNEDLVKFSKILFDETKDLPHAEIYMRALYEVGDDDEVIEWAGKYADMVTSSAEITTIVAWAYYRLGKLSEAKTLAYELAEKRKEANDRQLLINIAITSGDWSSLATIVEGEWVDRAEREGAELLRAGQLAQNIGSLVRSKELIREAASKAAGNAEILLGCYTAAISAGWENDGDVHEWLDEAVKESGVDGPVKQVPLADLVDSQAGWREREQSTWKMLEEGQAPMYAAAQLLNRTLLDLHLTPALRNMSETDVRSRDTIFAFSGVRAAVSSSPKRLGLDVTSILTLSMLGLLQRVIDFSDRVLIAHTTLGWLLEERSQLKFHQPSKVADAQETKRLIDSCNLLRFEGSAASLELEHKVGRDLAQYLESILSSSDESIGQQIIVRPYPVPKPDTLLDEPADIEGYERHFAGCLDVVDALNQTGRLTTSETNSARRYLQHREEPWPHVAEIKPGATLFLDDLAVSYLQHLRLLSKLQPAGFKVFVSESEIQRSDALIRHEANNDEAMEIVEKIRTTISNGIASGAVILGRLRKVNDDDKLYDMRHHPTHMLFATSADVDAFVIDDRYLNQHRTISNGRDETPVFTTIDILDLLEDPESSNAITQEALAKIRNAGMTLVPIFERELLAHLKSTTVVNGRLAESAELRSIRESILQVRMSDVLQLPKEHSWMDGLLRTLLSAIKQQWTDDATDDDAAARSNWLFQLVDLRSWLHRLPTNKSDALAQHRAQILMLLALPDASPNVKKRYWNWVEGMVLTQLRDEEPQEYASLITTIERLIVEGAIETAVDDGYD